MTPRKPSDPLAAAVQQSVRVRPVSRRERWLMRGLLTAAALLVVVSVGMTVGRDAWRHLVRRWETGDVPLADVSRNSTKELPPPLPELGLPPPVIPELPPAISPPPVNSAQPEPAAGVAQAEVVIEPVLDGHMIEPEHFDAGADQTAAAATAVDPERSAVEELLLESDPPAGAAEEDIAETAPEVPWLTSAPARDRIRYASALKRLLKLLAEGNRDDRHDADDSYQEARRLCADDPRLPLIFGLYLQQTGRPDAARECFEESADREGQGYLPTLEAAATCRLQQNDIRRAWPHLVRLAELISAGSQAEYPSPGQRRRAAEWLGSVAAYLESLPDDVDGRKMVDAAGLRAGLPEQLQTPFDTGRTELQLHLNHLQQLAKLPSEDAVRQLDEVVADLDKERQSLQSRIDELRAELHEATTELRDANEAEKKARGQLALATGQRRLAREAVADLSQPRTYAYTATSYEYVTNSQGRQQRVPVTVLKERPENSSERAARLASLQQASAAVAKLDGELPGLKSQHDEAKNARDNLVKDVRDKTQDSRRKLVEAEKLAQHADHLLSRLTQLRAEPKKLAERLKTPALLLDWNPQEIGDRVRASLNTRPKPAQRELR